MEESGTKLHIPLVLKHFVLFPQKLSVCGRVCVYLHLYDIIFGYMTIDDTDILERDLGINVQDKSMIFLKEVKLNSMLVMN